MIDFKEEIKKFKPVLEADDLERELENSDANDIVALLQYLTKKPENKSRSRLFDTAPLR